MSRIRTLAPVAILALSNVLAERAGASPKAEPAMSAHASAEYYTLIAEIALTRDEPRVAALSYVSAAAADASLWRRATVVAAGSLQPTVALDAAEHWIGRTPTSLAAHLAAADAARSLYQIAVAADNYRFVIAHFSGGVEAAFPDIEQRLAAAENPYAARQIADRLTGYFPTSAGARRLQGFAALQAGDYPAAARAFRAALARLPAARAHGEAAAVVLQRRRLTEALRRARVLGGDVAAPLAEAAAALRKDPRAGNRYDYAILLLAANKPAAAYAQMRLLLHDPRFGPDALHMVALLDFQDGRVAAARARFAQLLAGGHYADESYYYLGLIADRQGDLIVALRELARVRHGIDVLPAMMRVAMILRAKGAASSADALLGELTENEPQRAPQIIAVRAQVDARVGETQRALEVLGEAIREYPDDPALQYARASIEDEAGQTTAALAILRAVLAARPDDPEAMNAYGYTLADHGLRLERAQDLITRALAVAPDDAAMRDSLAWVLYREGRLAQALPIVSAAYADAPGGDIGAHYGEILWRLGRRAAAERVWQSAAAIDPDDRLLRQTRQRLTAAAPALIH
ncbi:MAG TPA: tetratricopeptide repeat protein [Steroidobacteraceae bacterium]|nr:tetratricopeptide repeat protein [Steroidobacteraceae bacterium]